MAQKFVKFDDVTGKYILSESGTIGPRGFTGLQGDEGAAGANGSNGTNGTNGVGAYTTVTTNFTQPSVSGTVAIVVGNSDWMSVNQILYIATGGYYLVTIITNQTNITIQNLGYTGNASPSATINSSSGVSAAGLIGATGSAGSNGSNGSNGTNGTDGVNAFTTTTSGYTQPSVNANVTIAVASSAWMSVDQVIYVSTGGYYQVVSLPNSISVSAKNLGYTGNASPAASITSGQTVSPGGLVGATGAAGSNGTNGTNGTNGVNSFTTTTANFTQPAINATVSVQVTDSSWVSVGQSLFIETGGYYTVTAVADSTHVTAKNLGHPDNALAGATINSGAKVSPSAPLISRETPIDSNTIIQWKLDETASPWVNSGNGGSLNLTANGTVTAAVQALFDKGMYVTSNISGLESANTSINPSGTAMTASIWCYFRVLDTGNNNLLNKEYRNDGTHTSPFNAFSIIQGTVSGQWISTVTISAAQTASTITAEPFQLTTNVWTLLAITYDGSTLRTYFNGIQCATASVSGTIDFGTNGPYGVGGYANGSVLGSRAIFSRARVESVVRSADYLYGMYKRGLNWLDV